MSCFPCFSGGKGSRKDESEGSSDEDHKAADEGKTAQIFTFRELATATENFQTESLLGEGGIGRVYKGCLETTKQFVAVKQLDRTGLQDIKEFLAEIVTLSRLNHPNLVNLIGYCADGEQRLLVYEFMQLGSLEDHLLDLTPGQKPLPWHIRVRIANGAANGLEYLHEKANPPVIYSDLKSSNVLLDDEFTPKLSDFGLAKLGPGEDKNNASSRLMGTYGYGAPEYARTGELTLKSDVYSFGVLLLELITGRRAIDTSKPANEQNLVSWVQPMLKDQKKFPDLADPLLSGKYPIKELNQAIGIAAMCLQEEPMVRPMMSDVVMTLSFLSVTPFQEAEPTPQLAPTPEQTPAPAPTPEQTQTPTPASPQPSKVKNLEEKDSDDNENSNDDN